MKSKYYLKLTGKYLLRMVTLLIAVSIISFILVSLSPVDPVQQYVGSCSQCKRRTKSKNSRILGAQ